MPECFFAHLGNCEGRLVKAHLIPKQRIKREVRTKLLKASPLVDLNEAFRRAEDLLWDERVWTWMCGGPTGLGGHHGAFDAKQLRIPLDDLPVGVTEFAREYGLEWSVERDYV